MKEKINGIFVYSLNVMSVPNLSFAGSLGAQLESVMHNAQTDRGRPGEYSADSSPARLVLGPELSNKQDQRSRVSDQKLIS